MLKIKDNISGVDLADMQLISKFNKGFCSSYTLLTFIVNMCELVLWKIKKVLQLLRLFKKY